MEEGVSSKQTGVKVLQDLVRRVRETVQTKADHHFLDKYRCHFEITQPNLLVGGQLKKYQLEALEWMINLASQDSNGILADDMGLGKTIQAIAYLAYLKEEQGILGKHLIVCPKSVAGNWARELAKWFPSARVALMVLNAQTRETFLRDVLKPRKFDIIITNYEGAKICIGPLSRIKWETMIVDEAHKLKNFESQNFQCLNYLKTGFRLLLTGTPLNNNLKELWTLLNFIMPDLFHEADMFERIEEGIKFFEGSEEDRLTYQCRVAKCFHDIINPFFKRRIKKELELGLPDKTELTIFVPLSKLQLRMYRNFLRFGNVFGDAPPANYNIMIPRKLCQHPYLFPGVEEGEGLIADSGKLCVMDKLVTKLIDEKHKILIFSQFVVVLDVLAKYCKMKGYRYSRIDGSDTLEQRDIAVHNFYDKPEFSIFLLSTRAGGLGLNLVAADRVILYDIDWNPQNDLQAMDRAYRIGQTRPVTVYRLVTEKTIEERMLDLQKYKLVWDELVIQKGLVFSRGKEDPFSNINFNDFSRLGKGDIVHLEPGRQDQTIEEILSLGVEKNKQKEAEIRERLKQQINEGQKISLFQENEKEVQWETDAYEDVMFERRNYDNEKRERAKFDRNNFLPAYKFYTHVQLIRDIEFEIHMESKREKQNQKLLEHLYEKLTEAQSKGRFHNWSQHEFELFVSAHETCRKTHYAQIAAQIGSKTEEEVRTYSQYFFEKAPNNERLIHALREIQRLQGRLAKSNPANEANKTVKIVAKEESNPGDEQPLRKDSVDSDASEESAATEEKSQKKRKKKTPEEVELAKQEKERLKQERQKAKQEEKEAREKKRQQEKVAREKKREEEIQRRLEARIKKEEEAKARQAAKKLKEEERVKRNAEREVKRQQDLEERERKKIEEESKKKLQEGDNGRKQENGKKEGDNVKKEGENVKKEGENVKKEGDNVKKDGEKAVKKVEKEASISKRTEKSGGRQGCSAETKQKRVSKERPPTVTVHDN